jgi:hypothetical protein
VQSIIDHTTRIKQSAQERPAWDSSWQTGVRQAEENIEQASGCLSDFAGVGMCGVKPFNSGTNAGANAATAPLFGTCGSRIHDMVCT